MARIAHDGKLRSLTIAEGLSDDLGVALGAGLKAPRMAKGLTQDKPAWLTPLAGPHELHGCSRP